MGDPNDAAAMWLPGETYQAYGDEVVMHVESWTSTTATVSLSNRALHDVYITAGAAEPGNGTQAGPWNTVEEGYSSAFRNGTLHLAPGVYNGSLRMTKPCVLMREGTTGVVRITN